MKIMAFKYILLVMETRGKTVRVTLKLLYFQNIITVFKQKVNNFVNKINVALMFKKRED